MASYEYPLGCLEFSKGNILWLASGGSTIRLLLLKTGYTYSAAHQYVADLTPASYELTVSGYSRASLTLLDALNDSGVIRHKAVNPTWESLASGETIIAAAVYKFVTDDDASPLLWYLDCTDTPTNGSGFTWKFNNETTNGTVGTHTPAT
jgi:hypothetical protein